ncbi:alpha/beta hydrolase [Mycolicibacterium flavescens]|uniref:Epoxide hydrolase n=1 Tax=Mycolicibacterium flavescens TaxID=1776 RepID=A0A1E3RKE2_MYCFV|nr:alpha/beta hydrolase [Mycolicibacterium flavescens]MCV7281028.1 alpha/beta hydrolase [Mycolicibacterium flavescens]ODQ90329.1 epoxide hydrolase [Mycolicibacterium flavescens]
MWSRSSPVDGFRLAYDRCGTEGAPPVVLLHGWPGNRHDFRRLVPLIGDATDVIAPDLRGFGGSDKHDVAVRHFYSATAQAGSVIGLIKELELSQVVLAGYDVGSRVAQSIARMQPDLVRSLVLSPPLPGAGDRVLTAKAQSEFWYQAFHQLPVAAHLIDGNADAVREYLRHFWTHWSGPEFSIAEDDLDRLVADYALPGAFAASIAWYRAGAGMIAQSLAELPPERAIKIHVPTDVVWPQHDPLFPPEWADRLGHYFTDVSVHQAFDAGHFTPLECPDQFAELILIRARPIPGAG